MGAKHSTDKRSARREHRATFMRGVDDFRKTLATNPDSIAPGHRRSLRPVMVVARKRPLFASETDVGEFDAVTVVGNAKLKSQDLGKDQHGFSDLRQQQQRVFLHDARMKVWQLIFAPTLMSACMHTHDRTQC